MREEAGVRHLWSPKSLAGWPLVVLVPMLLSGCDSKNTYAPPPPTTVSVAKPVKRDITIYFDLTGNTAAMKTVSLEARVQGFLASIDYTDGARVKKGAQLFTIQRNTYEAQLTQAKATLQSNQAAQANAQANYDRQFKLSKNEFASQSTLDSAKAQLDQAVAATLNSQAAVDLATINLGYTQVTAPFDGNVTNHLVDVGALVGVSGPTQLATIVQTDPLYIYFNVSEDQVLQIKRQLAEQDRSVASLELAKIPIGVGLTGETGYPHAGRLDYISPQIDSSTGTLTVRGLVANADHLLLPGLFVRVRVPTKKLNGALLVRDDAIASNQQGDYVLVVNDDNVVSERHIVTGQREGQFRIVQSGLGPEDWVVTAGVNLAIPGAKVTPQRTALDADLVNRALSGPANPQ